MPEIAGQAPAPLPTAEEVAAHNAAIKAKVASQDAAGDPKPDPIEQKSAGDALDALAQQLEKKKPDEQEPPASASAPAPAPEADDAAAKAAAAKAEEEKAAREAELKKADDFFKDAPSLPQGASVKSHEAFSSIKVKAAQEISKLSEELEKARKELETHKQSAGKATPEQEQLAKENEELKKWRAKLDVEFDPKFKEYDTEAEQSREFIYAQLRKSSAITPATIEKIKQLGGPDKIQMKPVLDALNDTTTQRLVEAKLADIEMAKYKKEQAVTQSKTNIEQYMTARQEELTKASTAAFEETRKELDGLWKELPWTKPLAPKQGATEAEKTQIDNHNKFVESMRKELDTAAQDNSPRMKATMLTAVAQLFNLQENHKNLKEAHAKLEKEVTELRTFKDKIKGATRSRLPESQAPASGAASVQKPVNQFNTPATEGLDALARQVMAERAAKAGRA
jgi:hypothetical protein